MHSQNRKMLSQRALCVHDDVSQVNASRSTGYLIQTLPIKLPQNVWKVVQASSKTSLPAVQYLEA